MRKKYYPEEIDFNYYIEYIKSAKFYYFLIFGVFFDIFLDNGNIIFNQTYENQFLNFFNLKHILGLIKT
ncbi:hypothetical protein BpHYR1_026080 [Brachionus plicatilis]|uniref:Uncharacterized protein n=1 Tax=Brachionus plicatilis TaxID=10195 RepID=A0A3M7S5M2_BRAPC|nr:hypothetical protein BpHYR1_026080 [Brachionus plicatilis]